MLSWLQDWWNDFKDWMHGLWDDFTDFVSDLFIGIAKAVLEAIAALVNAIPMPDFLSGHSMQTYLSGIDPAVLYFLSMSGIGAAFALLGSAVAFRLLRKLVTFGQW